VLPALSVAVQVTVVVPMRNVLPLGGSQVGASVPSTVSLAEAVKVTTAPAGLVAKTLIVAGTVSAGGVVSTTMTMRNSEPVLPAVSVAVQVTVVVPNGKTAPDGGAQLGVSVPSTASVAEAA
jgi:hypothetical protein